MTRLFELQPVNGQQIIQVPGGAVGSHLLYIAFVTAPSAGTATVEYRRIGASGWIALKKVITSSLTSGELAFRIDGPVAGLRITIAGLVGGTGPNLWLDSQSLPADAFNGLAAITTQNYTETNAKNGVQYEISSNTAALAIGGNIDTIFTTGANPVVIKSRSVRFSGVSLTTRVYKAPTFTGGTVTPYFNLSDKNPVAGSVVIRTGATVTATGTEFGAPTFDIGSDGLGSSSLSTFSTFGIERVLAPNTTYLQRITNDSAAIQRVASYLTWYEGQTDIPL